MGYRDRRFFAGPKATADYFGVSESTIRRHRKALEKSGFFELERRGVNSTNKYRVLTHEEWAEKHPGSCVERLEMPWDHENDPLGQRLFAVSGGDVHFLPYQILQLHATGLEDEAIVEHFDRWSTREGALTVPHAVPGEFITWLRNTSRGMRASRQ
jgi:hypothetical protein